MISVNGRTLVKVDLSANMSKLLRRGMTTGICYFLPSLILWLETLYQLETPNSLQWNIGVLKLLMFPWFFNRRYAFFRSSIKYFFYIVELRILVDFLKVLSVTRSYPLFPAKKSIYIFLRVIIGDCYELSEWIDQIKMLPYIMHSPFRVLH